MQQLKTFVLLIFLLCSVGGIEIFSAPASQNAFLNSTVVFRCSAREVEASNVVTLIVSWRINGDLVTKDYYRIAERPNTTYITSQLTLVAEESYNNSGITCTAFTILDSGEHNQIESMPPGYLRLQGLLNSVSNLSVQYGLYKSVVMWTAPYSLPGLDIQYNLTISNQSHSQSLVLLNQETYEINTMASLASCSFYNFTLRPWNDVGPGEPATIVKWFAGEPIAPDSVLLSDVVYNQLNDDVEAVLTFPVTSSCFYEQNITAISKVLSLTYRAIITKADNKTEVVVTILGLPLDQTLFLQLTLTNHIGNASLTGIAIRTYDVQEVNIVNTTISESCFQCTLSTNSTAVGCYLKLIPTTVSSCAIEKDVTLYSDESLAIGCISGLYTGVYNVEVYDVESNNDISQQKSFVLSSVNLKGMLCPSSTVVILPSTSVASPPTGSNMSGTNSLSTVPTVTAVDETATGLRTAGILIGVFGTIIILTVCIMVFVFIYNRSQTKGGVFTITSDTTESSPVGNGPTDRVDGGSGGADSPELVAVHPFTTSEVKSEYSPPREHDITMETSLQEQQYEVHTGQEEGTRNKQFVVMQSHKTGRTSRASSSSSGSVPTVYVRHGSGEYDHLIGDQEEIEHTPQVVPLDTVVIDSKTPQHDEDNEIL